MGCAGLSLCSILTLRGKKFHRLHFTAEGQEPTSSWAAPPCVCVCVRVCCVAYAAGRVLACICRHTVVVQVFVIVIRGTHLETPDTGHRSV